MRRRKRKRLMREPAAEPRLTRANQEWAMDFIVDGLANGRMVRILSVVDVFTRECLALEADTCLGSGRVTRVLERLIDERGLPEGLRSDNGPNSPRGACWAGPRNARSTWYTSSPDGPCRTATWRVSMADFAMSA